MIPATRKIPSSTYWPMYLTVTIALVAIIMESRRWISGYIDGFKGGTEIGLALAYVGSFLLVGAQFYTIVKRSAWIGFIKRVGGVRPWLTIHIGLSFLGLVAVALHAGFPYRFNSQDIFGHGLAGLTMWLLIASSASGVFGRYIYKQLPAMKRAFGYWKPSHLFITGMLFFAAIFHMLTAFGN